MVLADPDTVLERGLVAAREWERATTTPAGQRAAGETVTGVIVLLDAHFRDGGPLPSRWVPPDPAA